jgi:hypothetical protein
MPYIAGRHSFPYSTSEEYNAPRRKAFIRLRFYLWNVLAFRHDQEREREAHWQKKADDCASELRRLLDPTEASAAIGDALRQAKARFADELASEVEWRRERGIEPKV